MYQKQLFSAVPPRHGRERQLSVTKLNICIVSHFLNKNLGLTDKNYLCLCFACHEYYPHTHQKIASRRFFLEPIHNLLRVPQDGEAIEP